MTSSNLLRCMWDCTHTHTHTHTEVTQSCPTLCDPMDCSPPDSSVHGIFQAWILEWVPVSFSRGPSWPRDWTRGSRIIGRRFSVWATRVALLTHYVPLLVACVQLPRANSLHSGHTWSLLLLSYSSSTSLLAFASRSNASDGGWLPCFE